MKLMSLPALRIYVPLGLVVIILGGYFYQGFNASITAMVSDDPRVWEADIAAIELQDKEQPPAKDVILFVGSSTIAMWDSISVDMAPLNVVGRGFGGAKIADWVYHFDRVFAPQSPSAVAIYLGSNDVSTSFDNAAKSVDQTFNLYQQFVEKVKLHIGSNPIYLLQLKPTPGKEDYWPALNALNAKLETLASSDEQLYFIAANDVLFKADGSIDESLLRFDTIHLNEKGNQLWGNRIKEQLSALSIKQ